MISIKYSNKKIFKDFAHSPSKLKSTINAVKNQYKKKLLSIYELHSSSSLNKKFLPAYKNSISESDYSIIYISSKILLERNLDKLLNSDIKKFFNLSNLIICRNPRDLLKNISNKKTLIIFPQGTRVPPGEMFPLKKGAKRIYENLNIACLPVKLDTGKVWPKNSFLKYPGKINFIFKDIIEPNLSGDEFLNKLSDSFYN